MSANRPRRLLRSSQACKVVRLFLYDHIPLANNSIGDFCHRRRIKCQRSALDPARCQSCSDFDVACVFSRPSRRGAPRPQQASEPTIADGQPQLPISPLPRPEEEIPTTFAGSTEIQLKPLTPFWQTFARTSIPTVKKLLRAYHETVYPM